MTPLTNAHAHNDYEHTRPLFDALDQGFNSVEADVFLVDGKLLVGHTAFDLEAQPDAGIALPGPDCASASEPMAADYTRTGRRPGCSSTSRPKRIRPTPLSTEVLAKYADILTTIDRRQSRAESDHRRRQRQHGQGGDGQAGAPLRRV